MRIDEIRGIGSEELAKQLEAAHKELFDLRFQLATKQLTNVRQMRVAKKNIARLETVLWERELGLR